MAKESFVWIVPELSGGIHSYSSELWPSLVQAAEAGPDFSADRLLVFENGSPAQQTVLNELKRLNPSLIHIQHEYGLFGSKKPFCYRFPQWMAELRKELPQARIVATAHSVLSENYRFQTEGQGWQKPIRWAANQSVLPWLRRRRGRDTWGVLDAVVVHSKTQVSTVQQNTSAEVMEIPHFVRRIQNNGSRELSGSVPQDLPWVVIFGYLSPEKGHDVALRAWPRLQGRARLLIAGGIRRPEDQHYADSLSTLVKDLNLSSSVSWMDYVPDSEINSLYEKATLTLAPFRDTSGSGSITQAFARGCPVVASDLELNREINLRVPGAVELFKTEDPNSLAERVDELLKNSQAREKLRTNSIRYADQFSPEKTARTHLDFYRRVLQSARRSQ